MASMPDPGLEPGSRVSIEVPGLGHGSQPFPLASRRGPLLATSAIHGTNSVTGEMPAMAVEQIPLAFDNLDAALRAAGGSMDDVVQVLVTLVDKSDRSLVNDQWLAWFPDPTSRPTRNTIERELGGAARCSLIAYAWIADSSM